MYSFYHPVEKTTKTSKHEASQDSIFCTLDRYKSNPCKESKEILTQRREDAKDLRIINLCAFAFGALI